MPEGADCVRARGDNAPARACLAGASGPGELGFEPRLTDPESGNTASLRLDGQSLTADRSPACTSSRTQNAESAHETPGAAPGAATQLALRKGEGLETLAQAIADLSADDRARLAAMLAQGNAERRGEKP